MFDGISTFFSTLINTLSSFFNSVGSVLSYVWSILKALWFGLTSLITGAGQLLYQIVNGELFGQLADYFVILSKWIGTGPAIFIASMMFIIMFRIVVAFVLKFFRMNIDYKTLSTKYNLFHK